MYENPFRTNQLKFLKYMITGLSVALAVVSVIAVILVVRLTADPKTTSESVDIPTVAKVTINKAGFGPQTTSVLVGSAVEFVNADVAPHWIESDPYPAATTYPLLNAKAASAPGESFVTVMDKAGNFTYHDKLNPTITGTITVRE